MLKKGVRLFERDLVREPLAERELEKLFAGSDPRDYLNPRHELYRRLGMKTHPPSREEAIRLMAKEPNLIRRPLVARPGRVVAGYDEAELARLLG